MIRRTIGEVQKMDQSEKEMFLKAAEHVCDFENIKVIRAAFATELVQEAEELGMTYTIYSGANIIRFRIYADEDYAMTWFEQKRYDQWQSAMPGHIWETGFDGPHEYWEITFRWYRGISDSDQ